MTWRFPCRWELSSSFSRQMENFPSSLFLIQGRHEFTKNWPISCVRGIRTDNDDAITSLRLPRAKWIKILWRNDFAINYELTFYPVCWAITSLAAVCSAFSFLLITFALLKMGFFSLNLIKIADPTKKTENVLIAQVWIWQLSWPLKILSCRIGENLFINQRLN